MKKNLIFILIILFIVSCGKKNNNYIKPNTREKKIEVDITKFQRKIYKFKTSSYRDPFIEIKPFISNQFAAAETKKPEIKNTTNKISYRLGGIIWSKEKPIALIYQSDGKKWIAIGRKIVYPEENDDIDIMIGSDTVIMTMPDGQKIKLETRGG